LEKRPSAIIFDFGGVVVHWDPRRVYRRLLKTEPEIEEFFKEVGFHAWNAAQDRGGKTWDDAVEDLASRFPHRRKLIAAYHEFWEDSIGGPIDETVQIVKRLRDRGYRVAGLSNWSAEKFALTRARYELFHLFDPIVISGEALVMKPERAIFDLILRKLGAHAEECVFIDDSLPNVEAAAALGFKTIHFQNAEKLDDALRRLQIF
jgi:2-haloacid dehalogenase